MAKVVITDQKIKSKSNIGLAIANFLIVAAILAVALFIMNASSSQIQVVGYSSGLSTGTQLSDANIKSITVERSEYDSTLGQYTSLATNSTGSAPAIKTGRLYVLWGNKSEVVGKYVGINTRQSDKLELSDLTNKPTQSNPWLSSVATGEEFYQMSFDATTVYDRLIIPGSYLRFRLVANVSAAAYGTIEKAFSSSSINVQAPSDTSKGSISSIEDFSAILTSNSNAQVSCVTVAFDAQVSDLVNKNGQSMYDLYSAFSQMNSTVRAKYFKTKISSGSSSFLQSLTPTKIVLAVTPEQATALASIESSSLTKKITVLQKSPTDSDIYGQFESVSDEIYNAIAQSATS